MVQVIDDPYSGNIFGRLGKGIGQALSEQLPKESERYRLSKGLQKLGEEAQDLSPLQQYARVAGLPGITPAHLQALPEILKQQNVRSAFSRNRENVPYTQAEQERNEPIRKLDEIKFAQIPGQVERGISTQEKRPSDFTSEQQKALAEPRVLERNPLSPELIPKTPWTAARRNEEIRRMFDLIPGITFPEARELAAENEKRELSQPIAEQEIDQYLKGIIKESEDEFDKQAKIKFQKEGKDLYSDLTGEMQLALKKGMNRDLKINSKMTPKEAADKWTEIGLNQAKAMNEVRKLANKAFYEESPSTTLEKLKSASKKFSNAGNKEFFYNQLMSGNIGNEKGFKFSPARAAQIAYPRNEKISSYYKKSQKIDPNRFVSQSRKIASDIEDLITSEDSLLAIARDFKDKDKRFSETEFFRQLREDEDRLPLTPRQQRELVEGESASIPNWDDIWYFRWPTLTQQGF